MLNFIYKVAIIILIAINLNAITVNNEIDFNSESRINSIFNQARTENWHRMDFGELITKIASQFIGTPYEGGTLEGKYEVCRINLNGLDCVTFVENVLNLAKNIKQQKYSIDELFESIIRTRYRDGIITNYSSRLHYTADWIYQNQKNRMLKDLTTELGGEKITFNVNFMSKNPKYYQALLDYPELISEIELQEKDINNRTYFYMPKNKVKQIEKSLQDGDIICIITSKPGLDYAHLGFIYSDNKGNSRFMHSSLTQKKVIIDTTISEYLKSVKTHIGITILRPMEPKNND